MKVQEEGTRMEEEFVKKSVVVKLVNVVAQIPL